MTSDDNAPKYLWDDEEFIDSVQEDEEFWEQRRLNIYDRRLVKPMKKPLTAPWDLAISDSDVEKLKAGFSPRNQDDKYTWQIEEENGNLSIHVIRSFSNEPGWVLHIASKSSTDNSASAKIHSITWDGELAGIKDDVEKAKERVTILARVIPKCDFENAPATAYDPKPAAK
jgi:hypothetical protein